MLDRYALGLPTGPQADGIERKHDTERSAEDFAKRGSRGALGAERQAAMRLPKFKRRIQRQRSEAEKLPGWRQREHKMRPLRAEVGEAPDWPDGSGRRAMEEIRDLYGPPLR